MYDADILYSCSIGFLLKKKIEYIEIYLFYIIDSLSIVKEKVKGNFGTATNVMSDTSNGLNDVCCIMRFVGYDVCRLMMFVGI